MQLGHTTTLSISYVRESTKENMQFGGGKIKIIFW